MAKKAETTFKITGWKEDTKSESEDGNKIVHAHVTRSYSGDLEGEGTVEYLMAYREDGSANFVGYEIVVCAIDGRSGSFVLEHKGTFEKGTVNSLWTIVEASGTGALSGISGTAEFIAGHQEEYPITLNYTL